MKVISFVTTSSSIAASYHIITHSGVMALRTMGRIFQLLTSSMIWTFGKMIVVSVKLEMALIGERPTRLLVGTWMFVINAMLSVKSLKMFTSLCLRTNGTTLLLKNLKFGRFPFKRPKKVVLEPIFGTNHYFGGLDLLSFEHSNLSLGLGCSKKTVEQL